MQIPNTRISDRLFLIVAILAALFALIMHAGIARTNVPRDAWKAAGDYIRSQYKRGDAIGLLPAWALKGAEPLRGLPVLYAPHLHDEDLSHYRRLWVLAAPRLGKWWFRKAFEPQLQVLQRKYWLQKHKVFQWRKGPKGFALRKDNKGFNRLDVYLFKLPPPLPLLYHFQAKKHLRLAEVGFETPASRSQNGRCRPSTGGVRWLRSWQEHPGWFRGRGAYFFGRIIQEIRNTPRDCLYAQPKACQILKVRFRNVPLKGTLTIDHGFTTAAPAKVSPTVLAFGPDVLLDIYAEQRLLKRLRVSQKQRWNTSRLQLSQFKFPYPQGSVEFQISTPDLQHGRTGYCFRANLRKD